MQAAGLRQYKFNDGDILGVPLIPVVVNANQKRLDSCMRRQGCCALSAVDSQRLGHRVELENKFSGELRTEPPQRRVYSTNPARVRAIWCEGAADSMTAGVRTGAPK